MPTLHSHDDDCIFCKIISRSIPCAKVFENDHVLAFLDINPIAQGHTLVVPKGHYATLLDVPPPLGVELIGAMQRIADAVLEATNADGFNCLQNNFSAAGQMVFHAHWHIIPRFLNDGLVDWPASAYPSPELMQNLAESIRTRINTYPKGEER